MPYVELHLQQHNGVLGLTAKIQVCPCVIPALVESQSG